MSLSYKDCTSPARPMGFTILMTTIGPIHPITLSWPTYKYPMKITTSSMISKHSLITTPQRNIPTSRLSKSSVIQERSPLYVPRLWIGSYWLRRVTTIWSIFGHQTSTNLAMWIILQARRIWYSWRPNQINIIMLWGLLHHFRNSYQHRLTSSNCLISKAHR